MGVWGKGGESFSPEKFLLPSPGDSTQPPALASQPVIRAVSLTKKFGTFVAAHDITFEVQPGRIFGLLGPNGAGKSTTFRMLCGLSRPTEGECFVAGMNLLTAGGAARAKLGYMAQKFSLYGELTVQQNMRLMADLYGLERGRVKPRIEQLVEALDLETFRDVRAFNLPLGQKQRLCLGLPPPPSQCSHLTLDGLPWPAPRCTSRPCCSSTNRHRASTPGRAGNSGSTSTP